MLINQDQADNGVTGNTLVTNDCKELVDAGVMNARSDDAQKSLCGNSCYDTVNAKYKTLLDNDCFASDDADEEASAKLQAASYQIACQTNSDGEYCGTWPAALTCYVDLSPPHSPPSPRPVRCWRLLLTKPARPSPVRRHRVEDGLLLPELPPVHAARHARQCRRHGRRPEGVRRQRRRPRLHVPLRLQRPRLRQHYLLLPYVGRLLLLSLSLYVLDLTPSSSPQTQRIHAPASPPLLYHLLPPSFFCTCSP